MLSEGARSRLRDYDGQVINQEILGILKKKQEEKPMKYVCPCGYEYDPALGDPDNGIAPGTAWEDVPADFTCPVCGLDKDAFEAEA